MMVPRWKTGVYCKWKNVYKLNHTWQFLILEGDYYSSTYKKPILFFSGQFTIYSQNNPSLCAGSKFIGSNKKKIPFKSWEHISYLGKELVHLFEYSFSKQYLFFNLRTCRCIYSKKLRSGSKLKVECIIIK